MPCPPNVPISIIPPVSQGVGPLVWANGSQIARMTTPLNPSFLVYDGSITRWGDGSASSPIFLPNLQQVNTSELQYVVGAKSGGELVFSNVDLPPLVYNIRVLIVGGGGSGGTGGGGGGGGGFLDLTIPVTTGILYPTIVGIGGVSAPTLGTVGGNGFPSSFGSFISYGGGGGGSYGMKSGGYGASGGGSSAGSATSSGCIASKYIYGQGSAGGASLTTLTYGGSGGGGAGGSGSSGSVGGPPYTGGNGGNGLPSDITGSLVTYAGGGGGFTNYTTEGSGGIGGGGKGGNSSTKVGSNGTNGLGGGGGGGTITDNSLGGDGGNGIVILSIPTVNYSGISTNVTSLQISGSNTILKYEQGFGSYTA